MMHDRTGDQLWEKGDKVGIIKKIILFGLPAITIHEIGNLLKSIEAYCKRTSKVQEWNLLIKSSIDISNKKI